MQGLVVENIADLYKVEFEDEIYECLARGKIKKDGESLIVGDIVDFEIKNKEKKLALINEICKRNVYIKRPKISNVSKIILVVSSKNPKPDLLMLDKQLAFAEFLGINVLIVLNKLDLDEKNKFKEIEKIYKNIGYNVILTEAKDGIGIDELKKSLKNNINVFSGNSGVGKSTLINKIFSSNITAEGEISSRNKRGKNTTTNTTLYKINKNTYIADTPGFSTFNIDEIESKQLENYFIEFKKNRNLCEFVGCSHIKEQNCNIKKLVKEEKISLSRYENYCKIYNELKNKEDKKW